jgi:hypothetical protein
MSSEAPVPMPRTAVPLGVTDPVEKARGELKAALAAIEVKANLPRRLGEKIDDGIEKARAFQRRSPVLAAAAVVAGAAVVGAAVWAFVRSYSR